MAATAPGKAAASSTGTSAKRMRILVFNDPHPLRINKQLAIEIGFLESVVLLQLEYLISIARHERDGNYWTYQTLKALREEQFPWLSMATISRTLQSLEDMGLIVVGNYNRSGFDRTQWYALNPEGIGRLASVRMDEESPILQNENWELRKEKSILQNAKSIFQDAKSISQDETTIPKNSTKNSTKNSDKEAAPQHKCCPPGGEGEVTDPLAAAWQQALVTLAQNVNVPTFEAHLKPLRPVRLEGDTFVLAAPSAFTLEWIIKRHEQHVREALETAVGHPITVEMVLDSK